MPFDRQPSVVKVLVEGVIYYIGVAVIEELYVRGLLLNLIEKICAKRKNSTLIAVVLSSVIFGLGHIFGVLNQSLLVIVSKVVWTIGACADGFCPPIADRKCPSSADRIVHSIA